VGGAEPERAQRPPPAARSRPVLQKPGAARLKLAACRRFTTTGGWTYEANLARGHGADERDYTAAAHMLSAVGVDRIRLLSNNPGTAAQLDLLGIAVTEQVRTGVHLSETNARYLSAKREHTAHLLDLPVAG
jgi:GTP cyclohydrolase II